jgi:hypothetical protein
VSTRYALSPASDRDAEAYRGFPLQRLCTLRDSANQAEFARDASTVIVPGETAQLQATDEGLLMLAQNQVAQGRLIGLLQAVYGDLVDFGPIEIRYRDQEGVRTEPHMALKVECRTDRLAAVIEDLSCREAFVTDQQCNGSRSTLRATAPLALLLGYPTLLVRMDASATLTSWLAFYARMGGRSVRRLD